MVDETDDPARAARRLMSDDGFNTGVLYRGIRKPYGFSCGEEKGDIADIQKQFEV